MADAAHRFEPMALDDFEELLADKPEDERWELLGGRVVKLMVGARWEHKRLIQNLTVAMMNAFRARGSSCRPYDETFYLKDPTTGLSALPDVMVRCGPLEPGEAKLSDPAVIIEVVSPGGEARDRVEKWGLYQRLPSLRHYVLASRDRMHVEVWTRSEAPGAWAYAVLGRPEDVLALPAVEFEMTLAEVYRDVIGV